MTQCPCCGRPLVSCIRNHHQYYFCPHCWAEMPNLQLIAFNSQRIALPQIDTDMDEPLDTAIEPLGA